MTLAFDAALERILGAGDDWFAWRALRLTGEAPDGMPSIPDQDDAGGFLGPAGGVSPGATGEGLCQLALLGLVDSGPAVVAGDWLEEVRTPAQAWLDRPEEVPGLLDNPAAARVWATASAACGLLAMQRDPGARAIDLLRGEATMEGRFTGGAYPTFAAAGVYWMASGPKTEMAEWALRWAREERDESWGPWEWASALRFWGAAGVPAEHASVELFIESLKQAGSVAGFEDLELTLLTLELVHLFED